ncbi:ABC transporter permease [Halobacillus seohaensis]|uniref:ABC transporter permease n=1 Tax=Halobacillus seohaensis TaxID=447421 RepID=A0ABW2ELE3_9BACI
MNSKKLIAYIIRIILWVLVISFFWWAISGGMFGKIFAEPTKFKELLTQHLHLVSISAGLAILTSVPLGILVTRPRFRRSEWLIVNIANLGQTIPSLAVLALAMGFLGIGLKAAIVALYIYSLLPILQNTIAGLDSVRPEMKDAAKGMGLTPLQVLFRIELPSASASILAGIRTAVVLNIGTAALAYLIGGGGLGVWIFTGIQLFDNQTLISGAIPVTLLAVLVDFGFRGIQYLLVPKGIRLARKAAIEST